jgi:pSer/pThr/pTyr-binding forkhead associated (FHA) protein
MSAIFMKPKPQPQNSGQKTTNGTYRNRRKLMHDSIVA